MHVYGAFGLSCQLFEGHPSILLACLLGQAAAAAAAALPSLAAAPRLGVGVKFSPTIEGRLSVHWKELSFIWGKKKKKKKEKKEQLAPQS
jgi:hypothetical protein